MTHAHDTRTSRGGAIGAWTLVVASALLVLNGTWLFFGVTMPAVVEADTGVPASELAAAYPGVASELHARGRSIALLLVGVSAMALVLALGRLRRPADDGGRAGLWTFAATLLALGVHGLAGGRPTVGGLYLGFAVVVAAALAVSSRSSAAEPSSAEGPPSRSSAR